MTIFITGGAGFIGSNFVHNWIFNSNEKIVNLDLLTYSGNLSNLKRFEKDSRHIFIEGNILDKSLVKEIFIKYNPRALINFAAESHVDRSINSPDAFIQTNIVGTYNLLECTHFYWSNLSDLDKKGFRFFQISTDEVFGSLKSNDPSFTEKHLFAPNSPYSASKASSDHLVRAWNRTYGLPTIISNCSNNYGPYQFPEKLIPHIILNAIQGKSLPIYGNGLQIRDWLYVNDHAKAIIKIFNKGKIGHTYNVGGLNQKTNLEVVKNICEILENLAPNKPKGIDKYRDLITFVKDRPGHDERYAIDASKIINEIGWSPEENFDSGLRKSVKWYLDNSMWWKKILLGSYKLERIGIDNN